MNNELMQHSSVSVSVCSTLMTPLCTGNDAPSFYTSFSWVSLPPDISSFWVKVCNAEHNLGQLVYVAVPTSNSLPKLLIQGSDGASTGIRQLRNKFVEIPLHELSSLKDQGKEVRKDEFLSFCLL